MNGDDKHCRYSYRLSKLYQAKHPALSSIAELPQPVLEYMNTYTWYGVATESSPVMVENYPSDSIGLKPAARIEALNKYLLDNKLPAGSKPGFQRGRRAHVEKPFLRGLCTETWKNWLEFKVAKAAAQSVVSMRVNQVLRDGNHRTSILMLYESIADEGWTLRCEPYDIYVIISNRHDAPWEDIVAKLANLIERTTVRRRASVEGREIVAEEVKNIPLISAALEALNSTVVTNHEIPLETRRAEYREHMRQRPKMKQWFQECFPNQLMR